MILRSPVLPLAHREFFMPGLVDTHIHAAQYSYAGTALDLPLLDWLQTYTFPVESLYSNPDFARNVYTHVVVSGAPLPLVSVSVRASLLS